LLARVKPTVAYRCTGTLPVPVQVHRHRDQGGGGGGQGPGVRPGTPVFSGWVNPSLKVNPQPVLRRAAVILTRPLNSSLWEAFVWGFGVVRGLGRRFSGGGALCNRPLSAATRPGRGEGTGRGRRFRGSGGAFCVLLVCIGPRRGLAFTRYIRLFIRVLYTSQYYYRHSTPPLTPPPLYFAINIAQYTFPPRPPPVLPFNIQYNWCWCWHYRVKAKALCNRLLSAATRPGCGEGPGRGRWFRGRGGAFCVLLCSGPRRGTLAACHGRPGRGRGR